VREGRRHHRLTVRVVVVHTGQLESAVLRDARELLVRAFDGELTGDDWEHCLGGMHALSYDGDALVGHAALVQRRLLHDGRVLRAGYVEGVAVRADARRRGHGAAVMAALEELARRAYDVAALASTDEALGFYRGRGWVPWEGPAWVLSPTGPVRTEDADDCLHVLPLDVPLDVRAPLTCDWREGDVW
jgi:aminoglycoside 2'-N-acetyltransferase I